MVQVAAHCGLLAADKSHSKEKTEPASAAACNYTAVIKFNGSTVLIILVVPPQLELTRVSVKGVWLWAGSKHRS